MKRRIGWQVVALAALVTAVGFGTRTAEARGFSGGRVAVGHAGFGRSFGAVRPAYGYRPSYVYRGGFYGGLGAFGLGLFVASLPYYYSTYWWNGVPYYYADDVYYRYNSGVRLYEKVAPPADLKKQATAASEELFAYPKNGQSEEQQARDKAECRSWAGSQTDAGGLPESGATPDADRESGYRRAQMACLEGRGYSVK